VLLMKLYVFNYVGGITTSYHSGGGLMIITDRDPAEVWREYASPKQPPPPADLPPVCRCSEENDWWCVRCDYEESIRDADLDAETLVGKTPDLVLDIGDQSPERIITFPDSGCC
jgi:hypothetical protein